MQRIFLLSMSFILAIAGCKKTVENPTTTTILDHDTTIVQGDRQIRFPLSGGIVYDSLYWLSSDPDNIHKFNIDYYGGVDSVIYSFYSFVQNGNYGTIELYNFTDSIPIEGSLINVLSNEAGAIYQSRNLAAAFPHKEITLGLRLKGSVQGNYLNAIAGYLYLYRE